MRPGEEGAVPQTKLLWASARAQSVATSRRGPTGPPQCCLPLLLACLSPSYPWSHRSAASPSPQGLCPPGPLTRLFPTARSTPGGGSVPPASAWPCCALTFGSAPQGRDVASVLAAVSQHLGQWLARLVGAACTERRRSLSSALPRRLSPGQSPAGRMGLHCTIPFPPRHPLSPLPLRGRWEPDSGEPGRLGL